jgi:hypothetical protein
MTKPHELSKIDLIIDLLKDPDRKSLLKIISEVVYLFCIYRELPVHYFSRYLFKKDTTNIKDYLPNNSFIKKIALFFNDQKVKEVLDNKLFFDFYYSQFNICLPKILMYNYKKMFVFGNKSIELNNPDDFIVLLKEIFKLNSSYDSIIIKKTYGSSGGDKIYKLFLYQLTTDTEILTEIYSEVTMSGFLFQETIKQHPDLNRINPSSLNTIRFDTFTNIDGEIEIISGYLRMSIKNLHVDNISSGGCQVGIQLLEGKLKKIGYTPILLYGVKVLTEHPVTKTTFENTSIPFFSQAKELVLEAARYIPGLRLVGWDVAIGESGPVLIEGNSDYGISSNDLSDGGYMANPTFKKVLKEIDFL